MALWKPPSTLGLSEIIGRRIFDKSVRHVDEQGSPLFEVNDFYEKREGADISVDRLGVSPTKQTKSAITGLADSEATQRQPKLLFLGWASIRIKDLKFPHWEPKILASPTADEEGKPGNIWHAEISQDGFRERAQTYTLATALLQTFQRKGYFEQPQRNA